MTTIDISKLPWLTPDQVNYFEMFPEDFLDLLRDLHPESTPQNPMIRIITLAERISANDPSDRAPHMRCIHGTLIAINPDKAARWTGNHDPDGISWVPMHDDNRDVWVPCIQD
jgi:hypothetical protein